jgi:hypothetical protein
MKTLREYIDQLDEISRRDFLKGAGATAGLAAMGASKDAEASDTMIPGESNDVRSALILYYMCKKGFADSGICAALQNSISKYFKAYPRKRDMVNFNYRYLFDKFQKELTDQGEQAFKSKYNPYFNNGFQKEIIEKLNSYMEFSGTPPTDTQLAGVRNSMMREEEVDETATPDAVARIEELVKYK